MEKMGASANHHWACLADGFHRWRHKLLRKSSGVVLQTMSEPRPGFAAEQVTQPIMEPVLDVADCIVPQGTEGDLELQPSQV